jgi:hypothetical protein
VSLILFVLIKPLTYFAFIQAFRYRVSRAIPMRFSQAIMLTLARAGLGIVIVGGGGFLFLAMGARESSILLPISWVFLYAERLFSWWLVGWKGAGLRGRRLVGWVFSGTLINAAFDFAVVAGLFAGWIPPVITVGCVAVFIALLHVIGRRESLRLRFSSNVRCVQCQYDLTGNLSGRCPECGHTIASITPSSAPALA